MFPARTSVRAFAAAAVVGWTAILVTFAAIPAHGAEAPKWMHALTGVAPAAYDEKTIAVELYAETTLAVQPKGKVTRIERRAYRILRPGGAKLGELTFFSVDGRKRITDLHAWCIPANGKDYEVKKRDALETGLSNVENGMLATDVRSLLLQIPAAAPGNIIGYEVEMEETPDAPLDAWNFQGVFPVREAHYNLALPIGWGYRATWFNHVEVSPLEVGANHWRWTLEDLAAVRVEPRMPPLSGLAGRMYVTLIAPPGQGRSLQTWRDVGAWYTDLARGRRDPSPQLKAKVAELTASVPSLPAKMEKLATFVQRDIRYVGIELGVGGYQPHAAADVLSHQYGDCKDKVTLLGAMLEQIGVQSYPVIINATRGVVNPATPATIDVLNHVVLAVAVSAEFDDPLIFATYPHSKLGRLLFFDPTNPLMPFGSLPGSLQGNFGVLVTPEGGELVQLPELSAAANGIARTATFALDESGNLRGDVREVRQGSLAAQQRLAVRIAKVETDRIKPIETLLASSLSSYQINKASIINLPTSASAFEWRYSIESARYAKSAGDIMLVRPRVLGVKSSTVLETKEPREHSFEFDEAERDADTFEITLPPGYAVESLPRSVDVDDGFAAYHSKTEVAGRTLRYTRTFEIDKLSVPVERTPDLRALYRIIESDERSEAVIKRTP